MQLDGTPSVRVHVHVHASMAKHTDTPPVARYGMLNVSRKPNRLESCTLLEIVHRFRSTGSPWRNWSTTTTLTSLRVWPSEQNEQPPAFVGHLADVRLMAVKALV